MKKLLLLLLLPVCLLAQEDKKPRKLFFEIKQGVGLPSIGIKYKNPKGNYWNVGVNTYDINIAKSIVGIAVKYTVEGFIHYPSLYCVYISYDQQIKNKLFFEHGSNFITLANGEDYYTPAFSVYSGVYYGNRLSIGFKLGMATFMNDYPENDFTIGIYFFPKIKLRI